MPSHLFGEEFLSAEPFLCPAGEAVPEAPQDITGPFGCQATADINLPLTGPQVPVCGAVLQPFIPYSICTFSDALFHIQKLALVLAIFIKISDHVIIPSSSKQVSIHFMKP